MQFRNKVIVGVGTLALLAGGTAYAAIPDSDDGEFHACVSNTGSLKTILIIDKQAGTNCPSNYTEEVWNQQGPAGSFSGVRLERVQQQVECEEITGNENPDDHDWNVVDEISAPVGTRIVSAQGTDKSNELVYTTNLVSDESSANLGMRLPAASYILDGEGRISAVRAAVIPGVDNNECNQTSEEGDLFPATLDLLVYDI